jgi:dolichol-phosphate mannosyltransferase
MSIIDHDSALPTATESGGPIARRVNRGPTGSPELTVIIPTRNEAANVAILLGQLQSVLGETEAEVLFVDDSDDGTPQAITDAALGMALPVRLLHREAGQRSGGLSTAVIAGMHAADGAWAVVMDGDLQHPPEVISHMFSAARRRGNDLVVASRYAGAGTSQGLDGATRKTASQIATRVTKAVFPRRVARLSDPMSGFFAVRLGALDLSRMRPVGYKILLELVVRSPGLRIAEVTFQFAERNAGESKASPGEAVRFAQHLARLRLQVARERNDAATASLRLRSLRFLVFGIVGLSGLAVNGAALWMLHLHAFHLNYLLAAALATQVSTAWNFVFTDQVVFRDRTGGSGTGRLLRFFAMNNVALIARLPLLALLVHSGVAVLSANVLTLLLLFAVRFLISDRLIFGPKDRDIDPVQAVSGGWPVHHLVDLVADSSTVDRARAKRIRYLPYRYDVAGMVSIGSQVRLPELEYFRAQWLDSDVDISLRVGDVGHRAPRARAAVTEFSHPAAVRYEEHLGRLGANFRIDLGSAIDVTVGPLLAHSPHVVYTNIVEALLRFVFASRGQMLLHSACVEIDGHGIMLSARTDTGKTGTILRLLREQGGRFLSDDMTIIDANARAFCFPKPLTISHHTLRAVEASDLTPAEWRRLKLQSRLHSKEGRSLALLLARFNLPIMAINAITQMMVPPPKYNIDRLVNCRIGGSTTVQDLFVIERGSPSISEMTMDQAVEELMINTADAYGFPPFDYFAPAVVLGDADYLELQRAERAILKQALTHVRSRRVASDAFTWADDIPRMLDEQKAATALGEGVSRGSDS